MEWITLIGFIVFGIILIIIEVIFVPGTTIVGIGGFVCVGYGIYLSFVNFDNTTGFSVLGVSSLVTIGLLVYTLKSRAWERFSLDKTIDSKVNEKQTEPLEIGQEGMSISSMKPIGKALFNDKEYEVRTDGTYLRENQPIRVVKIDHNKIFVEPVTEN